MKVKKGQIRLLGAFLAFLRRAWMWGFRGFEYFAHLSVHDFLKNP